METKTIEGKKGILWALSNRRSRFLNMFAKSYNFRWNNFLQCVTYGFFFIFWPNRWMFFLSFDLPIDWWLFFPSRNSNQFLLHHRGISRWKINNKIIINESLKTQIARLARRKEMEITNKKSLNKFQTCQKYSTLKWLLNL